MRAWLYPVVFAGLSVMLACAAIAARAGALDNVQTQSEIMAPPIRTITPDFRSPAGGHPPTHVKKRRKPAPAPDQTQNGQ